MRLSLRRSWLLVAVLVAVVAVLLLFFIAHRMSEEADKPLYTRGNFSLIEDGLAMGGILEAPPPGTRAVLNVSQTEDPYQAEVHRWEPIPDAAPAPSLDWLRQQVQFIDEQRRAGRPVYVHCQMGVSRSALVVTAYLMWREGWGRDQALAFLRTKRKSVRPNAAFMQLLLDWQKQVSDPAKMNPPHTENAEAAPAFFPSRKFAFTRPPFSI